MDEEYVQSRRFPFHPQKESSVSSTSCRTGGYLYPLCWRTGTKPSADLVSRFSIILEVPVEDLMSTSDEAMKAKADSQRITVSPRFLQTLTQFRIPKLVSDLMIFPDTSFFVCPQCGITLEFMKYCDCCGQCLNWKNYKHPRIVYPGSHGG